MKSSDVTPTALKQPLDRRAERLRWNQALSLTRGSGVCSGLIRGRATEEEEEEDEVVVMVVVVEVVGGCAGSFSSMAATARLVRNSDSPAE